MFSQTVCISFYPHKKGALQEGTFRPPKTPAKTNLHWKKPFHRRKSGLKKIMSEISQN